MEQAWIFLWVAIAMFVTTTVNVASFELLAERSLLKYRKLYFTAILRQDIAWFDQNGAPAPHPRDASPAAQLTAAGTGGLELPSSISGDTALMRVSPAPAELSEQRDSGPVSNHCSDVLQEGIGMKFGQGVMGFCTFILS